jgi:hypothetical protein
LELKATPPVMVERGEVVEYGAFRSVFQDVNIAEAGISLKGRRMPRAYARLRLKEWQHFGVIGDDFYFGFAIVDTKYLGNSFCYFLDRKTGEMVEHDRLAPPGVAGVARNLWRGECAFRTRDYEINIHNRLEDGSHSAEVSIEASSDAPSVRARIEVVEDLSRVQPLELLSKQKGYRPAYTHKVACPARGEVTIGGRCFSVDEKSGIALIDVTKAFSPYNTWWNWATCGGHDPQGRIVALNLSQGSNEEWEELNDNCLWVDGRISFLGPSAFTLDKRAVLDPWHIETGGRRCVLDFEPAGERHGKVNALVIKSDFHQPYGTFRGTAVDSAGLEHGIEDYFGVVEHHVARF